METLRIAYLQTSLVWEDANANRLHFDQLITSIEEDVDLIILPEMFTTGFSMHPSPLAEKMDGQTPAWLKEKAKTSEAAIYGSVIIEEGGHYFNRGLFVKPNGNVDYYDKRHLFTLAGEDHEYQAGNQIKIIEYKDWRFCLNICYDLRFPVWARNRESYDCLIYVANWPKPRVQAWTTLLRARAIENQSYVVGVNRVGEDANENIYSGQSAVIDMEGNYISQAEDQAGVFISELSKTKLSAFKDRLPFYRDADSFDINL